MAKVAKETRPLGRGPHPGPTIEKGFDYLTHTRPPGQEVVSTVMVVSAVFPSHTEKSNMSHNLKPKKLQSPRGKFSADGELALSENLQA